jgi:hypothetical protein
MATSFVDLFKFYQSTDYITYEKLLFCLFVYNVEEKMIFGFSEHEDGGYVVPPTYFREFGTFMDTIRPIYDHIDLNILETVKNKYLIYDFGPDCFDWNNHHKILSKIVQVQTF